MIEGSFTVTFEYPYWVGLAERHDERGYAVAKIIYGAEPSNEIVLHSLLFDYRALAFSEPTPEPRVKAHEVGYKRQQKELKRLMENEQGVHETARHALAEERERKAEERRRLDKVEREAEEARKRRLHTEKSKEKKRGH